MTVLTTMPTLAEIPRKSRPRRSEGCLFHPARKIQEGLCAPRRGEEVRVAEAAVKARCGSCGDLAGAVEAIGWRRDGSFGA